MVKIWTHLPRVRLIHLGNSFLALVGVVSMSFGAVMTYKSHFEHPQLSYIPTDDTWRNHLDRLVTAAQAESDGAASASASSYFVEVAGAVEKPGVFALAPGARVQDAILQANGFLSEADQAYVHRDLSLAEKVFDQQKIYIPFVGESGVSSNLKSFSGTEPTTGQKNLNQATQTQLQEISGIGEKRAEQILEAAPFTDWGDFEARVSVSAAILASLQEIYTL